ncbi:MAG: RNA methyltransferase [Thermoleophilia bacterium]
MSAEPEELVYGRNPVRELLAAHRRRVRRVFAMRQLMDEPWLAAARPAPRQRDELGRMCGSSDHQGVVALVDPYPYVDPADILEADGPIVVLDGAQDPRNMGAIARVAEGAGAANIVIARRGTPGVTPVVCKASAGAVEHGASRGWTASPAFLGRARDADRVVGSAAPEAERDFRSGVLDPEAVVVLGSEGAGLRPKVAAACTALGASP